MESSCRHLLPKLVKSFISNLLWACSISSQLPSTPQNASVRWRTSLRCSFPWGSSLAAALRVGSSPCPTVSATSRAHAVAPRAGVQHLAPAMGESSGETQGACSKTSTSKAWLDGMAEVTKIHHFTFFLGMNAVLVKGKGRPGSLNQTGATSALLWQPGPLECSGASSYWPKWEGKLRSTLFRKRRKTSWFRYSLSMTDKFFFLKK